MSLNTEGVKLDNNFAPESVNFEISHLTNRALEFSKKCPSVSEENSKKLAAGLLLLAIAYRHEDISASLEPIIFDICEKISGPNEKPEETIKYLQESIQKIAESYFKSHSPLANI